MLFNTLAVSSVLLAVVHAAAEPAPYKLGSMSLNNAFGLFKRQAGYQPTQTYCGPGADCAASCGADYIQCASSDGDLHCYDPTIKETCCPDGSGNSCSDGYYCTSDASGNTWCCPDGMDLAACAAAYSLTGSLVSETATSTPSSAPSTTPASVSASASASASASGSSSSSAAAPTTTSSSAAGVSSTTSKVAHTTATLNSTDTTTSSSLPLQVTGGADANVVPGLMLLAGALLAL
ncbi:uncharacterized protein LY89DRAFT_711535 [Mollisia scopiformis]|uniref:Uncharacterized protein n=1 Tax=Mollisia scopiformis TaxID=149040 RepID=A0A132B7S4_MOLSC|nr:uncharacterized protein LY89DRAFT_711535 [Mollisia scopiformis]KUJ08456.1 hypothetical protein LY89DRAFT_711535 [Mollisia scopiformis]